MNIQSILAVTDLSVSGNCALERAAVLALKHGARLKIMPAMLDGGAVRADALERTVRAGEKLAQRFGITVKTVGHAENTLENVVEEARFADLLVLSRGRRRLLASLLCSQPVQQLMRRCSCPVLVTRLEAGTHYGRIVVAVDFTPESKGLVQLAFALDDDAEVELFHSVRMAYETKLRYAEASAHAIEMYKAACIEQAHGRIALLRDSFDVRRNRVMSTIKRGDPARQAVIQQQYARAGLLVVGHRRKSWLMDFLAGSVAQRVLSWSAGDVLVVPHDFQGRAHAPARTLKAAGRDRQSAAFVPAKRSVS